MYVLRDRRWNNGTFEGWGGEGGEDNNEWGEEWKKKVREASARGKKEQVYEVTERPDGSCYIISPKTGKELTVSGGTVFFVSFLDPSVQHASSVGYLVFFFSIL